jgi:hypothetical protein
MEFMVRPFHRRLRSAYGGPDVVLDGTIEDGGFVFTVDSAAFPVATLRTGDDEDGEFAVVAESETEVNLGFHLAVASAADEDHPDAPDGFSVSLSKPDPYFAQTQAVLPEADVLVPPRYSVSVAFGPDGLVRGFSGSTAWEDS